MGAEYKLVLRSKAGAKLEETRDFLELAYTKRVNAPGLLKFRLRYDHKLVRQLQEDYQVEVWRRNPALGLDWYADFRGLFAGYTFETRQTTTFTATVPGQMNLLARRIIAWPASSSDNQRSNFQDAPAETVLKRLVQFNATASATQADGRDKDGTFNDFTISIEPDQGRGNIISWAGSRKNLLTELQKIAEVAGGDFDLVKTGAAAWEFRFYPGQLGSDKSSSVVFSLGRGNMANPKVEVIPRMAQVAIVGGQGKEGAREVVLVGSGDGPELFVDGRNDTSVAALQSRGAIALAEAERRLVFSFDVVQTPSSYYGLHYGLGDLIKAEYMDLSAIKVVRGVEVYVKDQGESIKVEVE